MCPTAQQFHQRWGDCKNVLYHLGLTVTATLTKTAKQHDT
jgi:hypothetical protein